MKRVSVAQRAATIAAMAVLLFGVGVAAAASAFAQSQTAGHHHPGQTTTTTTPTTRQTTTTTTTKTITSTPTVTPPPAPGDYPVHTDITATVFWVGEPQGNGSSEDNSISAYDDAWEAHYGGYDNYTVARGAPTWYDGLGFTPKENPFYLDLPYDDINNANAYKSRASVVPWASQFASELAGRQSFSLMKNQWVKMWRTVGGVTYTAYGQIEDAGPYVYNDAQYVFGATDARPQSTRAHNAGMDVSPALRDYLHFTGSDARDRLNNDTNTLNWQFVDAAQVSAGPWKEIVTTRQVYQP